MTKEPEVPRPGMGPGFLQDCQGFALLKEHDILDRAEARENLRQRYKIHAPEVSGFAVFTPGAAPEFPFLNEEEDLDVGE